MRRYFFHLLKGHDRVADDIGARLPDLEAVVREAQRIAMETIISEGAPAREWMMWKLDVKDDEGTRLFFFPFDEVSLYDLAEARAQIEGSDAGST